MNTADRSIALLDLALRRRFTFVEMPPRPELLKTVVGVDLVAVLTRVNERIAVLLDADHRIGHSYLMGPKTVEDLRFAWYHRVIPLLEEYFYQDADRLRAVLGKDFVVRAVPPPGLFDDSVDADDRPRATIERFEGDDAAFLQALRRLARPVASSAKVDDALDAAEA